MDEWYAAVPRSPMPQFHTSEQEVDGESQDFI